MVRRAVVGIQHGIDILILGTFITVAGYDCNFGSTITIKPEVGESGHIRSANYPNDFPDIHAYCEVDFEVCVGCAVRVSFDEAALPPCHHPYVLKSSAEICDQSDLCEYFVWKQAGSNVRHLSGNLTFSSIQTAPSLAFKLRFCYRGQTSGRRAVPNRWKISFSIIDTYTYRLYGTSEVSTLNSYPNKGVIRSPGFPDSYPRNWTSYTYLIQGIREADRIIIMFDDFDIDSRQSVLKIYDGGDRSGKMKSFKGGSQLPMYRSTSPFLLVEFSTGAVPEPINHIGFKATYGFVHADSLRHEPQTIRDCDVVKPRTGGTVEQHGHPSPTNDHRQPMYDCVWSLPVEKGLEMSVKVIDISIRDAHTRFTLEIRNTFHSDGTMLELMTTRHKLGALPRQGFTSAKGIYIRLVASLSDTDMFRFSYTPFIKLTDITFSRNCELSDTPGALRPGLVCPITMRCIPQSLACDGADHCGDNQDEEPPVCKAMTTTLRPSSTSSSMAVTCPPSRVMCNDGTCVSHISFCERFSGRTCYGQWQYKCTSVSQCYSRDERCDGISQCSDQSDEHNCVYDHGLGTFARSLGNTWFFFLPAVLLILTFAVGCVVYKTKKARNQYLGGSPQIEGDAVQMHTFPTDDGGAEGLRIPPPSYEEVVTTANYASTNTANEETEQPPTYEEVALMDTIYQLYTNSNGSHAEASPASAESSLPQGEAQGGHDTTEIPAATEESSLPKEGQTIVSTVGVNPIT